MKKIILLLLAITAPMSFASTDVTAHFSINGKNKLMTQPNEPAVIEIFFTDNKTNEVIKDYKVMHGKIMHMVLIKNDLSQFSHFHPYFDPVTGRFQITMNIPHSDPDNFDNFITEPGMYMLMADVEIKGKGMRMAHKMLMVKGDQAKKPLVLDPHKDNIITKEFQTEHGPIRAHFGHTKTFGRSNVLVDIQVFLEKWDQGKWTPLEDLDDWLSMGAHAIWASEKLMRHPMPIAHMHAKIPRPEPDSKYPEVKPYKKENPDWDSTLYFSFHDQNKMLSGPQKIWVQIKYQGKVYTLPFTFLYEK